MNLVCNRKDWLGMGILLFITKCHSCKKIKRSLKNVPLLPKIYFKIWYASPMCSDLGNF